MTERSVRLAFGGFTLDLPHLTLCRDGQPVKLGGRAANLLAVLAGAGGELVTRDRLLAEVWPGQVIDESAVRVHLSGLRKALGDDRLIVNEAGRGYRLTLPVVRSLPDAPVAVPTAPSPAMDTAAPLSPLVPLVGRTAIVRTLVDELPQRRFLTLAGPGGMGKTTVALATATDFTGNHGVRVRFVDFAPIADPVLAEGTVAVALGLPGAGTDRLGAVIADLAAAPTLLLLDNCEHLVDAAAALAEQLLAAVPSLLILATSREPLRAVGEWVHRLPALPVPPEECRDAAGVLAYPAAALFHDRARAVHADFAMDDGDAVAVAEICRRLDGIPLAIELAAARIDLMDPPELARRLQDSLDLLTRGRRTALPRHRTLRAALDWSYGLLTAEERRLLARLSVFRASFDARDAHGVAGGREGMVLETLAELVAKSLVASVREPDGLRYRLLDTTRHYGHERLIEDGDDAPARAAHARHLLSLFADMQRAWEGQAPREWLAQHSRRIADVRAALDWVVGDQGDLDLGLDLIVVSAPLWFHLSLPHEFLGRAEQMLSALDQRGTADAARRAARRVELLAAYGHALWHTRGPVPAMGAAFEQALEIAEAIGNEGLARRALWGVWAHRTLAGRYAESLEVGEAFSARVGDGGSLSERMGGMRMRVLSHHFSGDHGRSLALLQAVMAADADPTRATNANYAQVDGRIAMLSMLMRLRWMMGDVPAALDLARECADEVMRIDHTLSVCYGLAIGCIPVAIAAGAPDLALAWIGVLDQRARHHALDHWRAFADGYAAGLGGGGGVPAIASPMQLEMFAVAGSATARTMLRERAYQGWCAPLLGPVKAAV
ncbi:MAG: winged helix-turn-helix domain-containing protein [Azospirillaceae bacterium]|nr:winged helix-turn-helix domain-containing protein [Azospirillaceae bacterium]